MKHLLTQKSFSKGTGPLIAKSLLGKYLVRRFKGRLMSFMITEVELYEGFADRGSHTWRGKTPRNAVMFGKAGHWYVYFTYGVHWMLNLVISNEGYPAAILIRGVESVSGPGRLTKFLHIDGKLNGQSVRPKSGLWIEDRGVKISPAGIKKGPRVGIDYAGSYWSKRHLRFWISS